MRLIKLTLAGFKSFADRTEFLFEDDVTGVVGPNGCGKSNVVDAIKWVLGERSSKSLRGKEMIDVIFAGSAGRKPAGMASVSLTFENPVRGSDGATERRSDEGAEANAADMVGEIPGESASSEAGEHRLGEPAHQEETQAASLGHQDSDADLDRDTADSKVLDDSVRGRRALPIDADIVEVERRLYRDGTSQYLINSRRARLKDIRDLFLDTGVGADAYSIIEQGKVDAMLLASPQERRVVFEEAAGIARYKQRRIESIRKLERTDQNLTSTREQLDNTERRLRMVKGQAAKARRFKELDEEFRALRLALAFDHYDEIRQRLDGLTSRLSALEKDRREAGATVLRFDQARQEGELARGEALDAQRSLEQQRTGAIHTGESAAQRRAMLERNLGEAGKRLEGDREQVQRVEARLKELTQDIQQRASQIGASAEQLASGEQVMQQAAEARARVLESLTEQQSALAKRRATAAEIDRERTRLLASVQADERRLESLREQAARSAAKAAALAGEQEQVAQAIESLKRAVGERRVRIDQAEGAINDIEATLASLSSDRASLAASLGDLEQRLVRSESRRQTLQEMVEAREGLADAVKLVLDRKASGEGFASVLAPLADLVSAGAEHAAAIEAALGPDLQALVVRDVTAMPTREEIAGLVGRVTFLPLGAGLAARAGVRLGLGQRDAQASAMRPDPADWPVPGLAGDAAPDAWVGGGRAPSRAGAPGLDVATLHLMGDRVRPLRPLVQPDAAASDAEGVSELLDHLLGRTFLVAGLDTATLLSAGPLGGCRFVTADGACLEADGRLSAGPLSASSAGGLIQRRAELANLEREIAGLRERVEAERASLKAADAEAAALTTQRGGHAGRLATLQREQISDQTRLERAVADHARLERDLGSIGQEREQVEASTAKIEADRAALSSKAESLARLHEEQSGAAEAIERELVGLRRRHDEASEQLTASKIEVGRLGEQLSAARREHHALQAQREDAARRQRDLASSIEHNQARVQEHERAIEEASKAGEEARATAARLEEELEGVRERVAKADEAVKSLGERLVAARGRASAIERDWNALEASRREAEVRRETLEERTQEEIGLDLAFEYADYRAMMRDEEDATPTGAATGGMAAALGSHATDQEGDESAEDESEGDMAVQSHSHATRVAVRIVPVPRDEGHKRVEELRRDIKALGNVNLDSIEEERTLAARNDDLIQQVADLDAAGRQLRELIDRLNDASRARFEETFVRVQEEFGGKNGMFRRLFGGGKAEVRLMPLVKEINGEKVETDQVDMLESGVEIIAKPPGKEPRSISQLSGGEKTLTAVSLLMAIFRSKPSCFCVLDEVDAALDEGNVARFCNTIRQYTDFSRFIVITHNKRTMQAADRLYGVTMQERGVSKRVSVRFDQVRDDGSFTAKGDGGEEAPVPKSPVSPNAKVAKEREAVAAEAPAEKRPRRSTRAVEVPTVAPESDEASQSEAPLDGPVVVPPAEPVGVDAAAAPVAPAEPIDERPSRRLREALGQMGRRPETAGRA
ncbi:MAG: AAA family ATPase [Phycisphaerales bacterium]